MPCLSDGEVVGGGSNNTCDFHPLHKPHGVLAERSLTRCKAGSTELVVDRCFSARGSVLARTKLRGSGDNIGLFVTEVSMQMSFRGNCRPLFQPLLSLLLQAPFYNAFCRRQGSRLYRCRDSLASDEFRMTLFCLSSALFKRRLQRAAHGAPSRTRLFCSVAVPTRTQGDGQQCSRW